MTMTEIPINDPFAPINIDSKFSDDDLFQRFRETGYLWLNKMRAKRTSNTSNNIHSFLHRHAATCRTHWSVENRGDYETEQQLMEPTSIKDLVDRFYVSTIIHKTDVLALEDLLALTLPRPPLPTAIHNGGAWLFVGKTKCSGGNSKRKRSSYAMIGRAEHVDDVTHSGTWHYQQSGDKVWYIRPNKTLWDLGEVPDISKSSLAEQTEKLTWRLKVKVQEGDIFILNTRIWFHHTELEESNSDWSISIARDFYLPLPCPQNTKEGDIILEEDDIPTDIPRSDAPNCALAKVEFDETGECSIVLIAISDGIKKGDTLFIAEDNFEGEYNGAESIDPRALAVECFGVGDVVLRGEEIPDDLPRSLDPTCALVLDQEDEAILRALVPIEPGHVFSILPDDGEDYDEVEVALETGELKRCDAIIYSDASRSSDF